MPSQKHVLYISSIVPRQGTGGWILMDRHLRRLESADWQISLALPEQCLQSPNFPESWRFIPIPMRRWWWLPVKSQIPASWELRFHLWQRELEAIQPERPSAILTILWDYYSVFAAYLANKWDIPLTVIVHDQWEVRAESERERREIRKNSQRILDAASQVWTISPEMSDICQVKPQTKMSVLNAIPAGNSGDFASWQETFTSNPIVAHAGSLYLFHVPYLQQIAQLLDKIGGNLLLVCDRANPALLELQKLSSNIKHQELFAENKDVLSFLKHNASSILVCYPLDLEQHSWELTSFPSRLAEFTHLGLPIIILAPETTALANWAQRNNWYSYLRTNDEEDLKEVIDKLSEPQTWIQMAQQSRQAALTQFNPDLIQAQFEAELATK